jgi:hypothetical protein
MVYGRSSILYGLGYLSMASIGPQTWRNALLSPNSPRSEVADHQALQVTIHFFFPEEELQALHPLEIADDDATGIGQDIGTTMMPWSFNIWSAPGVVGRWLLYDHLRRM